MLRGKTPLDLRLIGAKAISENYTSLKRILTSVRPETKSKSADETKQ